MATEAELIEAIRRAGRAGDGQAVRVLGQQLERVRSQPQAKGPDYSNLSGDEAQAAYSRGREELRRLMVGKPQQVVTQAIANYENNPAINALKRRINETSPVLGFIGGAMRPIDNLATWASKIPGVGPAVDKLGQALGFDSTEGAVAANDRQRQSNTRTGYQLAGNVAATLPTLYLPGGAAVQGGATGALLSERPTDAVGVLKDAAIGAASGKAGEMTGKFIGGVLAGKNVPANVRLLANEGVTLTPGQRGGRISNIIEDKVLGSIPLVSDIPAAARARGANDLRVAAANRVLAPINTSVNRGTPINNEAIGRIQNLVENAYDNAISPLSLQLDNTLNANLDNAVSGAAREVGDGGAQQLSSYASYLKDRLANGLSGEPLKREIQALRGVASETMKKDPLLGNRMWGLHNALDDALTRQSGEAAPAYRSAREATALLQRFNDAASKSVNGEFGPTQLLQAAKRRGFGTTTSKIASGEAAMLDLANAAADVMRNTSANSGTVPRAIAAGGLLGGLGGGAGVMAGANPVTSTLAVGTALAPYTPGVDRLIQSALLDRPEWLRTAAQPLLRNAPRLGSLGAATGLAIGGQ